MASKKTETHKPRSMMDFIEKGSAFRRSLKISELTIDSRFQARVKTSEDHVQRIKGIIENTGVVEPVCVFFDKDSGRYYLWDGFHRVAAHVALGQTHVVAWVADGNEDDAMLYSCSANIGQSTLMSPTLADKKKAAKNLLLSKTGCTFTAVAVCRECGLNERTLSRVIDQMTDYEKKVCEYVVYRDSKGEEIRTTRVAAKSTKIPSLSTDSRGTYRFRFRGVKHNTKEKNYEAAARFRDEFLDSVAKTDADNIPLDYSLSEKMAARGVVIDSAKSGTLEKICGIKSRPGVIFSACKEYSSREYLASIGAFVIAEASGSVDAGTRKIILARPNQTCGDTQVGRLVALMAKNGVETMTPEEYIKEVEMERYFAKQKQSKPAEVA